LAVNNKRRAARDPRDGDQLDDTPLRDILSAALSLQRKGVEEGPIEEGPADEPALLSI
jgi:hypothetical protein